MYQLPSPNIYLFYPSIKRNSIGLLLIHLLVPVYALLPFSYINVIEPPSGICTDKTSNGKSKNAFVSP